MGYKPTWKEVILGYIEKWWQLVSETNIGKVWGVYWINCFEVTKNKKDQNFYKILANERLKAPNNCYKAHSRVFILLYILLYIVIDTILGNLLQSVHLFIDRIYCFHVACFCATLII